jgi:dihydropyrimidinase
MELFSTLLNICYSIIETLEARGQTDPYYHAIARPQIAEAEATYRAISLSELMDTPILLVHVSSQVAAKHIRDAQTRLLPIYGETCPQYLYLLSERLKGDNFEGAKCVCSPPLREKPEDLDHMWTAIANGTFTTFSSDHAASKFGVEGGKRLGLINGRPIFKKIPNGLPGLETRLPLLYKGVQEGRITINDYVRVACSNPAKLYGLNTKGAIMPGFDADFTIWYPEGKLQPFELTNDMLHHDIDYSPFEGMTFTNWPRHTILRGQTVWNRDDGGFLAKQDQGSYVKRGSSSLLGSRNVFINEWRPPV